MNPLQILIVREVCVGIVLTDVDEVVVVEIEAEVIDLWIRAIHQERFLVIRYGIEVFVRVRDTV